MIKMPPANQNKLLLKNNSMNPCLHTHCKCFLLYRFSQATHLMRMVMSGMVLSGMVMSGMVMSGMVMSGMVMSGMVMSGMVMSEALQTQGVQLYLIQEAAKSKTAEKAMEGMAWLDSLYKLHVHSKIW